MGNIKTTRKTGAAEQAGRSKITPPKQYGVFLLNDDYTPMDFVVAVLEEIFLLPEEKAVAFMVTLTRMQSSIRNEIGRAHA